MARQPLVPGLAGILLTGGASRRMGADKATLVIEGETCARRVGRLLARVASVVLEVGPGHSGLPAVTEPRPGNGPLVALSAAAAELGRAGHHGPALVLACDLPLLSEGLLRLLAAWPGDASVVPVVAGRRQSLCARLSWPALADAAVVAKTDRPSMMALLERHPVTWLDEEGWGQVATEATFADLDTPGDLVRLGLASPGRPTGGRPEAGPGRRRRAWASPWSASHEATGPVSTPIRPEQTSAAEGLIGQNGPVEHLDPVAAARRVADDLLAPRAEDTDQAPIVPRENLEALADAGLYGLACPGPSRASGPAMRQVQEALAGACGATYFVWAQHHSPVRLLAASSNVGLRQRWLERLCQGRALAGVAFAYLRRPGPVAVTAERVAGGWLVNGTAPFVTSWGLADVFVVVAATGDGHLVWFALEGCATDAVRASEPLALSVLQATSTIQLALDGLLVDDEDVLCVELLAAWRQRDRLATVQPSAATFGLAGRCCTLLAERARAAPQVTEAASALAGELNRCRDHGYALADALAGGTVPLPVDAASPGTTAGTVDRDPMSGDRLDEHLAHMVDARAWALDLAQRAALALVAAVGGRAMARSHPAQRLVREAAFYAVQAQTGSLRTATLARLSAPGTTAAGRPTPQG